MKKLLLLIIVSLALAGSASARLDWSPSSLDPNEVIEIGNWDVAMNWDGVDQASAVPTTADEARLENNTNIPCLVDSDTNAVCGQIKVADNGDTPGAISELTIKGSLITHSGGNWSSVAYNRTGIVNVERGGYLEIDWRIGVGLISSTTPEVPSELNINGGEMVIGQNLQIGTLTTDPVTLVKTVTHIGEINVNSGLLDVDGELQFRGWDTGVIDIRHGTLLHGGIATVEGAETPVADLITSGNITGFGVVGNVEAIEADGVTTITAITDPQARTPAMDAVVQVGTVGLSWNNLQDGVWVDVWYLDTTVSLDWIPLHTAQLDLESATVGALEKGSRVWRVDTYTTSDPNVIEGDTMYFFASDDFPPTVAMDTLPTATWINEAVELDITVTDDGVSPVRFLWESSDPNAVFVDPGTGLEIVLISGGPFDGYTLTEDPTVAVDYQAGTVTVTVTVADENPVGTNDSANVSIFVGTDECGAARAGNGMDLAGDHPADIVVDCSLDFVDFAVIAGDWQADFAVTETQLIPQD